MFTKSGGDGKPVREQGTRHEERQGSPGQFKAVVKSEWSRLKFTVVVKEVGGPGWRKRRLMDGSKSYASVRTVGCARCRKRGGGQTLGLQNRIVLKKIKVKIVGGRRKKNY